MIFERIHAAGKVKVYICCEGRNCNCIFTVTLNINSAVCSDNCDRIAGHIRDLTCTFQSSNGTVSCYDPGGRSITTRA